MAETPWLSIVGLGEDGPEGMAPASLHALAEAEVIMGPPRHLRLIPDSPAERIEWPVPFSDGLPRLEALRGRRVAVLASGDPFWFGAGSVIARRFGPEEWRAFPGPSTFSLAASRLGWPLEQILCLGLHAAPLRKLRPHLAGDLRAFLLLRDGAAVAELGHYLTREGFGESRLWIMEALGGPRERITSAEADALPLADFSHPVAVALHVRGAGWVMPRASGLEDSSFDHDGQITKRPIRALALSALAPRPGELLWDIGGGSGSVAIEWCLAHPQMKAISIEPRSERAQRIRANAARFGLDRLELMEGAAPEALAGLPPPHAIFIGGGLSEGLMRDLQSRVAPGTRLVAHAVTLESEALLFSLSQSLGGDLLRIDLAEAAPLGKRRGWSPSRPIIQWRVIL